MDTYLFTIRQERDSSLYKTDKYMLPDYPITPENLEKIKVYRQQLRDFFQKDELVNFPSSFNLPVFPF